jgi:hypothetical protein
MGKASSSKKVARAAGIGGSRVYGSRPPWMYYVAIVVLLVLGVVGVYNSREYRDAKLVKQGQTAPKVGAHWYEGFAVDACGKLLPPIKTNKDPDGITTKGDGIIYISPKKAQYAGRNATLGEFANSIGMLLNAAEVEVPGGHLYTDGDSCEGKPGHVYVMDWALPSEPASDGVLQDKKGTTGGLWDSCSPDCNSGVLLEDDQLVTVAFLPAPPSNGTLSVKQPPQSVISKLNSLEAAAALTTTTTAPAATTTTKAGETTTTKAGATATTAAATTTTAAATTTTVKPAETSTTK